MGTSTTWRRKHDAIQRNSRLMVCFSLHFTSEMMQVTHVENAARILSKGAAIHSRAAMGSRLKCLGPSHLLFHGPVEHRKIGDSPVAFVQMISRYIPISWPNSYNILLNKMQSKRKEHKKSKQTHSAKMIPL